MSKFVIFRPSFREIIVRHVTAPPVMHVVDWLDQDENKRKGGGGGEGSGTG